MEIEPIHVALRCLFCDAAFTDKDVEKKEPESGDLITCAVCGQGNDYDSVLEVAKEKGAAEMKEILKKKFAEEFKKLFK